MPWHSLNDLIAVLAWLYLLAGLDDLALDIYFWLKSQGGRFSARRSGIFNPHEKPIAIIIPAWNESGIIGPMLRGNLKGLRYKNYKFFVACYPNDLETINEVKAVASNKVVCVVNKKEGPTSKGQALNEVVQHLLDSSEAFDAILMQDSEDIMHPCILQSINHALDSFDFIQTPVYSLPLSPNDFISASYLDEFAEFHSKDQWVRSILDTATPSAGVGTAISFKMVKTIVSGRGFFLRNDSLTEDYELGHFVHQSGGHSIFLREIINPAAFAQSEAGLRRKTVRQIATLEYFPRKFRAAVRQKTRWMIGIVLQGYQQVGWYGNFANRYFLYRDRKGLVMNLLGLIGLLTILASLPIFLSANYLSATGGSSIEFGEATKLCLMLNVILAFNRAIQRCIGVHRVYHDWSLTLTAPFRIPVSLVINGVASLSALQRYYKAKLSKITLSWDKTQHELPHNFGNVNSAFDAPGFDSGALIGVQSSHLGEVPQIKANM